MLGLIFIYFMGRAFYQLAESYDKHQWGYAILGVASYYASSFVFGMIMGLIYVLYWGEIEGMETYIGLAAIPFALLTCFATYKLLERKWSNEVTMSSDDILDDGLL